MQLSGSRIDDWWARLAPEDTRVLRWLAPALVIVIAAVTRLWNLGSPKALVFDETFYVKDAWTLWNLGYEAQWPAEADPVFNSGQVNGYFTDPSFVVHPPLGKWIIGLGMQVFGANNPVGWRISTAVVGILAVVLLMLIARHLFKSMLLATIAGLLLAIEGNAIVMSRVALLDNSVMFFALLGFGAVLLDRRWSSERLGLWMASREDAKRGIDWGPALWWRPWLILAGLAFGLTAGVKWSGLYFLAAFAVYTLVVDAVARRRAGIPFWLSGTILKQGPVTFLVTVPIALAGYLATWTGWFLSTNGYNRYWADALPGNAWTGALAWVPHTIQSFWHFEAAVYAYNISEMRPHSYQANPLTWLLMVRPTSMYYQGDIAGKNGCGFDQCGTSITGIANPVIWWAATAAVLYLVYRLVRYREWRVGLILAGMAAGYLPWLLYLNRTVFQFYTIAFEPYMLLALTFVIGLILGSPHDPRWKRVSGVRIVAIYLGIAVVVSAFFWPLWAGVQIDFTYLAAHWWVPTWR
ncbi:MAG: phospholipid carrier-dependent glycosyltransferase [Rhodoglobus sp.]